MLLWDDSVLTLLNINLAATLGSLWDFMLTLDHHMQLGQCIKNNHLPFGIWKQARTLVPMLLFSVAVWWNGMILKNPVAFPMKSSSLLYMFTDLKKEWPCDEKKCGAGNPAQALEPNCLGSSEVWFGAENFTSRCLSSLSLNGKIGCTSHGCSKDEMI